MEDVFDIRLIKDFAFIIIAFYGDMISTTLKAELLCTVKPNQFTLMKLRNTVDELYEYQNLGVFKNYCGSFSTNVDENIEKATIKAGMIFSANFDRYKTNPFVYIKFWKRVCLPSLLFGVELFSLNKCLLEKLERCQR